MLLGLVCLMSFGAAIVVLSVVMLTLLDVAFNPPRIARAEAVARPDSRPQQPEAAKPSETARKPSFDESTIVPSASSHVTRTKRERLAV